MKRILLFMLMTITAATMQSQGFNFDEVTYTPESTTFKLFAPDNAGKVLVRIYQDGLGSKVLKTVKMKLVGHEQWTATVKGDLMGRF